MPVALDLLEAKKHATFAALRERERDSISLDARVARLEEQMQLLYRWALQQSKGEMSVREIFNLWNKMVSVCDFFIDYVRELAGDACHSAAFDGLLDLRLECEENREFHRGDW